MRRRLELYKLLIQLIIQHQNRSNVVTTITVIWSRPNRHQLLIKHLLVTLHYQLMSPHDLRNVVSVIKWLHYVSSKQITCSTWTQHPSRDIWVRHWLPSGSDHIKSHIEPSWGISCLRSIDRIYLTLSLLHLLSRWCWDLDLHARRRCNHRQSPPKTDNRKRQYSIAIHLVNHTCEDTSHRNHRLEWSDDISGYP